MPTTTNEFETITTVTSADGLTTIVYRPPNTDSERARRAMACTRLNWNVTRNAPGGWVTANVTVSTAGAKGFRVGWCGNRGNGWGKNYGRCFKLEADALTFAGIKASQMFSWAERQEGKPSRPIVLATMH
jgi:hypothetical protein